jgi:hypothetical protein
MAEMSALRVAARAVRVAGQANFIAYRPSLKKRKLLPEAIGGQADRGFTFQPCPVSAVY